MLRAILKEVIHLLLVLLLATMVISAALHSSPGGSFRAESVVLGRSIRLDYVVAKQDPAEQPLREYGFWEMYRAWLGRAVRFDLGLDKGNNKVTRRLGESAPPSLLIIGTSIIFSLFWTALFPRALRKIGRLTPARLRSALFVPAGLIFLATLMPAYVIGSWIRPQLYSLPTPFGGASGLLIFLVPGLLLSLFDSVLNDVVSSTRAHQARMESEEYFRMAIIKGANIDSHTRNDRLIQLSYLLFMRIGILLSGTLVLETAFNIRGIGDLLIEAGYHLDFNLIMGTVFLVSLGIASMHFLHRSLCIILDPRLRSSAGV